MVSLAIGAHAALNKRALTAPSAATVEESVEAPGQASRIALVIGNGHYPDANAPLTQPINDARGLTSALRQDGFDVEVVEDASKEDMSLAIGRLKSRIKPDSVVMLFFGGYGIQPPRELHDPGRCRDLERIRRSPQRHQHRIGAGDDEGAGRARQARGDRRLPAQSV